MRFRHDPETGLILPRERRVIAPSPRLCSMGAPQQALLMKGSVATVAEAVSLYAARSTYWEFEANDATSTYVNSVTPGTYDLTVRKTSGADTTSVQGAGPGATSLISGTRYWFPNNTAGNACYIPIASGFRFPNSDFSFGLWLRSLTTASGSARFILGDVGSGATTFAALLKLDSGDNQYHLQMTSNGSTATDLDSTYNPSGAEWTLLVGILDRANNLMRLKVRRAGSSFTSVSTAFASALYTGASSANFAFNCGLTSDTTYFSGSRDCISLCDQAFYFTKVMTDAEFDYLYNSGTGRTWAQLKTDSGN